MPGNWVNRGGMPSNLFKPVRLVGKGSLAAPVKSSLAVQDITYTAAVAGEDGDNITIAYTDGATAGSEVVSVSGNDISIQIETAVSTATQVKAAFDNESNATALASAAITGTASNAQVVAAEANLANGAGNLSGGPSFITSMKPSATGQYNLILSDKWLTLQGWDIKVAADSSTVSTETAKIEILNADAVDTALKAGTALTVAMLNSSMAEADLSADSQVFFDLTVSDSSRN